MITNFGANIDQYLQDKIAEDDRDYSYIHPSEFGGCLVETWLKMKGEKPLTPAGATKVRIFDNGHYVHLRNQIYAKESGVLAQDKVVSIDKPEEIIIGLTPRTKIKITGTSGRVYYYNPYDIIWRVDKEINSLNLRIGTDSAPAWDQAINLKKGDKWWLVEVPVVNPKYHFGGNCDAIVLNNGKETVIDYKGTGEYSWSYIFRDDNKKQTYASTYPDKYNSSCFICGYNVEKSKLLCEHFNEHHLDDICLDFKYKIQLHIYMMILNIDQAILWYENKNNQLVIDYLVQKDEELVEKIQDNATKFWKKIINDEKPTRAEKYKRSKFPCAYCDYASQCWNS